MLSLKRSSIPATIAPVSDSSLRSASALPLNLCSVRGNRGGKKHRNAPLGPHCAVSTPRHQRNLQRSSAISKSESQHEERVGVGPNDAWSRAIWGPKRGGAGASRDANLEPRAPCLP